MIVGIICKIIFHQPKIGFDFKQTYDWNPESPDAECSVSVGWDCVQFGWFGVADGSGVGGDSFRLC